MRNGPSIAGIFYAACLSVAASAAAEAQGRAPPAYASKDVVADQRLHAQTGVEVWRWYTTKEDGWEGNYAAATPDGMPLHRDIAAEKAAAQLYRNAWAAGSNST